MRRSVLPILCALMLPLWTQAQIALNVNLNAPLGGNSNDNDRLYVIQPSWITDPVSLTLTLTSGDVGFLVPFMSYATGPSGYGTANQTLLDLGSFAVAPDPAAALVSLNAGQHLLMPNPVGNAGLLFDPVVTFALAFGGLTGNLPFPTLDVATLLALPGISSSETLYIQSALVRPPAGVVPPPLVSANTIELNFSEGVTIARVEPVETLRTAPAGTTVGANFGSALASGDLDGDGFDDLVVGAPGHSLPGIPGAGRVFIYRGTAAGLHDVPFFLDEPSRLAFLPNPAMPPLGEAFGAEAYAGFGSTVAVARLDADTLGDVVVAAPAATAFNTPGGMFAGEVYVIRGSALQSLMAGPLPAQPTVLALDVSATTTDFFNIVSPGGSELRTGGRAGSALAVGDLNGDGRAELFVGAPFDDDATVAPVVPNSGRVYVVDSPIAAPSPGNVVPASTILEPSNPTADLFFGRSLAVGDIDGSPPAELAVGAPGRMVNGFVGAGQIELYNQSGFIASLHAGPSAATDASLGIAIAVADINDDGNDEVMASTDETVGLVTDAGAVYVWVTGGGAVPQQRLVPPAGLDFRRFGFALLGADLNDDGVDDLAIGAPGTTLGASISKGAAVVYFGNQEAATGPLDAPLRRLILESATGNALDAFGSAFAVGEFDGSDPAAPGIRPLDLAVGESQGNVVGRYLVFPDLLRRTPRAALLP